MKRYLNRSEVSMRLLKIEPNVSKHAEGSCLISFGDTKVMCTATVEEKTPPFLKGTNKGWVTAEYGMLPRSTNVRMEREAAKGKQSGRTQEIQRLIGRSLRSVIDLTKLGERQIKVDCDVIEADGGTRTAGISGGYIALHLALQKLLKDGKIAELPISSNLAAVSCGILEGIPLLDLDFSEDSKAEVDANFVMTGDGKLVEVQATAEGKSFSEEDFNKMLNLAKKGIEEIITLQNKVLGLV